MKEHKRPKRNLPAVRRSTPPRRTTNLRAVFAQQERTLRGACEAAIFEMQKDYGPAMKNLKIEKLIEKEVTPRLVEHTKERTLVLQKRLEGIPLTERESVYASDDLHERYKNITNAVATNFRGKDPERVRDFLYEFHTKLLEKLRQRT